MSVHQNKDTKIWRARVKYTYTDSKGVQSRKEKTKSGFKTKSAAQLWEAETKLELTKPKSRVDKDVTFIKYYDDWLEDYFKSVSKEKTKRAQIYAQKKAIAYFGDTKLSEITRQDFQRFVYDLSETVNPTTLSHYVSRVAMPLKLAFHDGAILSDPTFGIKMPAYQTEKNKIKFLEKNEADRLLAELTGNTWTKERFAMYTSISTGLRIGEILALQVSNIDIKRQTITVAHSRDDSLPYGLGPTKTPKSERKISAPNNFFAELKRFKEEVGYDSDEEVFGPLPTQTTYNNHLRRLLQKLEIDDHTFHHLRHTHGSYLILKGTNIRYVSERLGHTSVAFTEQVYVHVLEEMRKDEIEKMADFF